MNALYARSYQAAYRGISKFLPWRTPLLVAGEDSVLESVDELKHRQFTRFLLVTDEAMTNLGLYQPFVERAAELHIEAIVYDQTVPNPTILNIEQAYTMYNSQNCQAIVAFGGGSVIDCAKGVAARVAQPNKLIPDMKGQLKVRKQTPFLMAIPTTAGTGSEGTVAAVISNPESKEKYAVNDTVLIPDVAVLDPLLTVGLPPALTATTGMDALTHAVEAYIGQSNTSETEAFSKEAVELIFNWLPVAYQQGTDIEARKAMQKASYLAGLAFTRAYVGNVHAVAHTLGGYYNVPHGLANAVLLPVLLRFYGNTVTERLAQLAVVAGVADESQSDEVKAGAFIARIEEMNRTMAIPATIAGIEESDIKAMAKKANKEANPLYPVPVIMNRKDFESIYRKILA
ncbi:iron-containing alcohol dehydrogenase [Chryseomicrobium sp. FSL W7-1435]|uniref:iron-containing alcohol dehydrogenase n=1 Tax=Chryseomicrobium sp. FSL W7-1435 TaxID=2921704 RepID=UPI00315A286D